MRRICYSVAASLDGYIAGPQGEADWIPTDPEIDFAALFARFDTLLVGRRTYEGLASGGGPGMPGKKVIVVSRTLRQEDHRNVTIVGDDLEQAVADLRAAPGKDIWLFGGGLLFRSLLEMGLVDAVQVAIVPILLGDGTPLLPPPAPRAKLELTSHRLYRNSGIVLLDYRVEALPDRGRTVPG